MDPFPSPPLSPIYTVFDTIETASPPKQQTTSAMARTPESLASPTDRTDAETHASIQRKYFIPGETTLARSDEETNPLDIQATLKMFDAPWPPVRRFGGLPRSDANTQMRDAIYPSLESLLLQYSKGYQVDIREIDMRYINDLSNSPEQNIRIWLILSGNEHPLIKQVAREVGELVTRCGYPEVKCVILQDTYRRRIDVASEDEHEARTTTGLGRHFSLLSGNAIGPYFQTSKVKRTPTWEGTIGAFMTNGKDTIALCNSHVVGLQGEQENQEYRYRGASAPQLKFQMPAERTFERVSKRLPYHITFREAQLDAIASESGDAARLEAHRIQADLAKAIHLRDQILPRKITAESRSIGHSLWASGLTTIVQEIFSVDVGILLLNVSPGQVPQNKLPIVSDRSLLEVLLDMQLGNLATYPRFKKTDVDGILLRPNSYVTRNFIRRPPARYTDGNAQPAISVLMTGRTSGTNIGRLDDEFCRRKLDVQVGGQDVFVQEYTIQTAGFSRLADRPFSYPGDSGSMCIVADENGHAMMLGLVTGGSGITNGTDKTYVYPLFHFFEAVLPRLIEEKILPEGPKRWSMDMNSLSVA